jgi:hypothetical protein
MQPGFHEARGMLARFLRRNGFAAVTMPWRRVYILPEWEGVDEIIAHERVHLEQIERDGPLKFTVLYLWWLLRYGYEKNPYEAEAYAKAPV